MKRDDIIYQAQRVAIDLLPSDPTEWNYKEMRVVAELAVSESTTYFEDYRIAHDWLNQNWYQATLAKRAKQRGVCDE